MPVSRQQAGHTHAGRGRLVATHPTPSGRRYVVPQRPQRRVSGTVCLLACTRPSSTTTTVPAAGGRGLGGLDARPAPRVAW
jgi:hypothetical protein